MPKVEMYINKNNEQYFELLKAMAHIEDTSFSRKLGEAAEFYIKMNGGKPDLIAPREKWNSILEGKDGTELLKLHRYISELNTVILGKLYAK